LFPFVWRSHVLREERKRSSWEKKRKNKTAFSCFLPFAQNEKGKRKKEKESLRKTALRAGALRPLK
jgi:hypothetical protein